MKHRLNFYTEYISHIYEKVYIYDKNKKATNFYNINLVSVTKQELRNNSFVLGVYLPMSLSGRLQCEIQDSGMHIFLRELCAIEK